MFWFYHRGYKGFAMYQNGNYMGQISGTDITFDSDSLAGAELTFQAAVDQLLSE